MHHLPAVVTAVKECVAGSAGLRRLVMLDDPIAAMRSSGAAMSHLLQKAAEQGDTATLIHLLDKGDDIEWRHQGTGRTALVSAAIAGQRHAVELLIQRGANIDHQCTAVGYTSLAWASELGLTEIADLLILRGASLDLPSPKLRRTALMAAAQSGHIDVVRLLLDHGAKPELIDFSHDTAWSLAADRGHARITGMLEAAGGGAPTPTKPATPLPWPTRRDDVPATAEPAMVVHAYMLASHAWELHGHRFATDGEPLPDSFWQEADDIVARYCTRRERIYRRMDSRWPPTYTPDDELLSVRPVGARVEVLVRDVPREDGTRCEHLFVVKQSHGEWRVDSVMTRRPGAQEWHNGVL